MTHTDQDTREFLTRLNKYKDFFDSGRERFVSRAPGRLDVMGGIADYSGSLVLQMPIAESTHVALQPDPSGNITLLSLRRESPDLHFQSHIEIFERAGQEASKLFRNSKYSWAAYIAGFFPLLMSERQVKFHEGAKILIYSDVPEGLGVSSSAALEVATLRSINEAFQLNLSDIEIALTCQRVENCIAGAPCGVMDQMASTLGTKDCLLSILCQPAEIQETIPVPEDLQITGIDSGLRHSVSGESYSSVRTASFMGYRILTHHMSDEFHDKKWRGYLANINPSELESMISLLPEKISGKEFLSSYNALTDPVSKVIPEKIYKVRDCTIHPIYENFRIRIFAQLIKSDLDSSGKHLLGELMYQSHESYNRCGLGSTGTDLLIDLARSYPSIYGARISGGGSGGTVAVISERGADSELQELIERYSNKTHHRPQIFSGSSSGAAFSPVIRLS